jgi:hypothetical protein
MQWARIGASARIAELQAELADIYRAFPDLKGARQTATSTARVVAEGPQKQRRFSAAGKKAISQGMREYWARRKALAAKTSKAAAK